MFYVYIYLNADGSAYYVGKGAANRWRQRRGVPTPSKDYIQIFYFDTEQEAWDTEVQLIEFFGRVQDDGCLLNKSTGGASGTQGVLFSAETIRKRADSCRAHFQTHTHPRAHSYEITDPQGNVFVIRGIRKFSRENNLSHPAMCAVAKGKLPHHKGYLCRKV